MTRTENVRFWRGKSASTPQDIISGRLLFEEDTGNVFLDYLDQDTGQYHRTQLTDTAKFNISGGTFTGPVILFRDPVELYESATKNYVDAVDLKLDEHSNDEIRHISQEERESWNNKVDKEEGKALSSNDFTDTLKDKLENISPGATKTEFIPEATSGAVVGKLKIDNQTTTLYSPEVVDISGNAGTATSLQNIRYLDGFPFDGTQDVVHYAVCSTAGDVAEKELVIPEFSFQNGGFLLVNFQADNTAIGPKLKIGETSYQILIGNRNVYPEELTSGLKLLVFDAPRTSFQLAGLAYSEVTEAKSGLMSSQDKIKLNNIEEGANNYSLPAATSSQLGGVKIGNNITNNSGTISISRQNVENALGYAPVSPDSQVSYDVFVGATEDSDGLGGLVPSPYAGQQDSVLFGNGQWLTLPVFDGHATLSGLVPPPPNLSNPETFYLNASGSWSSGDGVESISNTEIDLIFDHPDAINLTSEFMSSADDSGIKLVPYTDEVSTLLPNSEYLINIPAGYSSGETIYIIINLANALEFKTQDPETDFFMISWDDIDLENQSVTLEYTSSKMTPHTSSITAQIYNNAK